MELTPADYAELWELSRRSVETEGDLPAFLSPSVEVGGVELSPPGVGMIDWMERFLQPAIEDESEVYWVIAMAWALSHARDEAYIRRHSSRRKIREAILLFSMLLPWRTTPEDLAWGVTVALGGDRRHVGRGRVEVSGLDWGEYIAWICNRYKLSPETVAWRLSADDVAKLAAQKDDGRAKPVNTGWHELRAVVDEMKARAREKK